MEDMVWARRRLTKPNDVSSVTVKDSATPATSQSGRYYRSRSENGDLESGVFLLEQTPVVEGALTAIDPRTGAILAMVEVMITIAANSTVP